MKVNTIISSRYTKVYFGILIISLILFPLVSSRVIEIESVINDLLDLDDTPSTYAGANGLCLIVNESASEVYFGSCSNATNIWAYNQTTVSNAYNYNETLIIQADDLWYNQTPNPYYYNQTSASSATTNIFNQDLNSTNPVSFLSLNFTSDLYYRGTNVTIWFYNQTSATNDYNYNETQIIQAGDYWYNQTDTVYWYNMTPSPYYYNMTTASNDYNYNETQIIQAGDYWYNMSEDKFYYNMSLSDSYNYTDHAYFYNHTDNPYYYNQTQASGDYNYNETQIIQADDLWYNQSITPYYYNQSDGTGLDGNASSFCADNGYIVLLGNTTCFDLDDRYYYDESQLQDLLNNDYADIKWEYNQTSSSIYYYNQTTASSGTSNIFNQDLNTTNGVTFDDINFTGDLYRAGTNVTQWLYNQSGVSSATSNIFDQDLNTTNNPTFNNLTISDSINVGNFTTGSKSWSVTESGDNMIMDFPDVGGNNGLFIETTGTFLEIFGNPGVGNDYEMFSIQETQGADTEINFYEGGTGHNRMWISGSARIGGDKSYLCSNMTNDVDCDSGSTGADLAVQDDVWIGGMIMASNWSNVSSIWFYNQTTASSGTSNIFNQDLNTTSNVTFDITNATRINITKSLEINDPNDGLNARIFLNLGGGDEELYIESSGFGWGGGSGKEANLYWDGQDIILDMDLSTGTPKYDFNVYGDIIASTNVSAEYFLGDGSQLTGVTASTPNIFNQDLNTTNGVTFDDINFTGDLFWAGTNVTQWLHNQSGVFDYNMTDSPYYYNQTSASSGTSNIFDQELNSTRSVTFASLNFTVELYDNGVAVSQWLYNHTDTIYYYNQSATPYYYNMSQFDSYNYTDHVYFYNHTDNPYYYNQTTASSGTSNIFNQDLNSTNPVSFLSLNFTSDLFYRGNNVTQWLHNQSGVFDYNMTDSPYYYNQTSASSGTSNIFDQDLNSTNNVEFANLTISSGNNLSIGVCYDNWNGSCLNTFCSGSLIQSIGCT